MKDYISKGGYNFSKFNYKIKKNILTGYGPQADRHFLYNKSKKDSSILVEGPFGGHASNGFIYSLVCSGILGLMVFTIINLIICFKIFKILFIFKLSNFNSMPFLTSSILIIIFLQFRILFENSFSVFGVDLLIFLSAYLIIEDEYRKLIN